MPAPAMQGQEADSPLFQQAGIALIGVEGDTIAAFNAASQRLFRKGAAAARGTKLHDLFVPFHKEKVDEALQRASQGIPSFPVLLAKRGLGAPTEVSVRVGPLAVGGKIVGATIVVLDVRAQNRTLRELRAERDAAVHSAQSAEHSLKRVRAIVNAADANSLGGWLGDPKGDAVVSMVPGVLFERALPPDADAVVDLTEALYQGFTGRADGIYRLLRHVLRRSSEGGAVVVRGGVQARRSEWALVRVEILESRHVTRTATDWAALRRRATELEAAIGHEEHQGQRRIWLTFNLVGMPNRSLQPGHVAGTQVALDVRSEAERDAIARRLRAWQVRVVDYAQDGARADVVVSDKMQSSSRVVQLGEDVARPIRRDALRDALVGRLAAAS